MNPCIKVSHERCTSQTVSVVQSSTQWTYKCAARTGHEGEGRSQFTALLENLNLSQGLTLSVNSAFSRNQGYG